MELVNWIKDLGFKYKSSFIHENIELSQVYIYNNTLVIIDLLTICETSFSYKRYCQKQNEWMQKYSKVYRFLEDDIEMARLFIEDNDSDYYDYRTLNREAMMNDPSPLEFVFEDCFAQAFNAEAYKYLGREQSIMLKNGRIGYVDYMLYKNDGSNIAIEENGVSYHHPYIIKVEKYRHILMKQNSVIDQEGIVFRWDTESLQNKEKIIDEIKEFFGEISQYKDQIYYKKPRKYQLYEHQNDYISDLAKARENIIQAMLVVLPVGTGKTTIALEDIKQFARENINPSILILVPSKDLRLQWEKELSNAVNNIATVEVKTYSKICHDYKMDDIQKYDYIVIDEAHHAVAPVMAKVIRHYNPKFLLGLTATDKRLDDKKLEDIFGNYDTRMSLKEAIQQNILCPIRGYRLETNVDLSKVKFNGKDYIFSQLERQIKIPSRDELIASVIDEYFHHKLPKSGIVFCISVSHAKDIAKLLKSKGIKAEAVDGLDKLRERKIEQYMNKEIQFLCTCSLLTEGWDAPHTSVIVMARPTLSKVLYVQQLGRGTRKSEGKEALYVVDVVDQYGSYGTVSNRPWSLNALFDYSLYSKFGNLVEGDYTSDELIILDTIHEDVVKLEPFDIFTLEKQYENFLSEEQLARELFVSTGTVKSWIRKKQIEPDVELPLGRSKIYLFEPSKVKIIQESKGLEVHTEKTIIKDFWDFIELGDYTFSYKIYFTLSMLKHVDDTGDADTNKVVQSYMEFYRSRRLSGSSAEKANSLYNREEFLDDEKEMKHSMLQNPFEKFERKRFMYYNKELSKISYHHLIWEDLVENGGRDRLMEKMEEDLERYYSKI